MTIWGDDAVLRCTEAINRPLQFTIHPILLAAQNTVVALDFQVYADLSPPIICFRRPLQQTVAKLSAHCSCVSAVHENTMNTRSCYLLLLLHPHKVPALAVPLRVDHSVQWYSRPFSILCAVLCQNFKSESGGLSSYAEASCWGSGCCFQSTVQCYPNTAHAHYYLLLKHYLWVVNVSLLPKKLQVYYPAKFVDTTTTITERQKHSRA